MNGALDWKELWRLVEAAAPGPWTAKAFEIECEGCGDPIDCHEVTSECMTACIQVCGLESFAAPNAALIAYLGTHAIEICAKLETLAALQAAVEFVSGRCGCSPAERYSGHLVGCWQPELERILEGV